MLVRRRKREQSEAQANEPTNNLGREDQKDTTWGCFFACLWFILSEAKWRVDLSQGSVGFSDPGRVSLSSKHACDVYDVVDASRQLIYLLEVSEAPQAVALADPRSANRRSR